MGSVTRLIRNLADGDPRDEAASALFDRYIKTLNRYASRRLLRMGGAGCVFDGEDAASVALTKVLKGIEVGQLRIASRGHFLAVIRWKALRLLINELGRPGGDHMDELAPWDGEPRNGPGIACPDTRRARTRGQAVWRPRDGHGSVCPDILFEAEEACRELLAHLTEEQRQIVLRKLLGYTHSEIAKELGLGLEAAVDRKMTLIRKKLVPFAPGRSPKAGRRDATNVGVTPVGDIGDTTEILRRLLGRC